MNLEKITEAWPSAKCAQVLPAYDVWSRVDSSKMGDFMACPRKYFYAHIMGLKPAKISVHLVAGAGIHDALEHIAIHANSDKDDATLLEESFALHMKAWRGGFSEREDSMFKEKGPANIHKMLEKYIRLHRQPNWKVLGTEISGLAPIGPDRNIVGRLDMVVRRNEDDQIMLVDHKTTTRMTQIYREQWTLNHQMNAYLHMLYGLYNDTEIYGGIINAIILRYEPEPEPLFLEDGSPDLYKVGPKKGTQKVKVYKGQGTEFMHIPFTKTKDDMLRWLSQMNAWYESIEDNFIRLADTSAEDDMLHAFPMNTGACTNYNSLCPYHGFCQTYSNPIQLYEREDLPPGFKQEYWDPDAHKAMVIREAPDVNMDGLL